MIHATPALKRLAAALAISWIALALTPLLAPVQAAASKVKLDVVHPEAGKVYWSGKVRYAGSTQPGNQVTVNGKATRVYASGAFVGTVSLKPGDNKLEIFNVTEDPMVLQPVKPKQKSAQYRTETARHERWYETTSGAAGENVMTEEDIKALKSLGYLQ